MFYRAQLSNLNFSSGHETLEVNLFAEEDIPWQELAFPVITRSLEQYFIDRKSDQFPVLYEELDYRRR